MFRNYSEISDHVVFVDQRYDVGLWYQRSDTQPTMHQVSHTVTTLGNHDGLTGCTGRERYSQCNPRDNHSHSPSLHGVLILSIQLDAFFTNFSFIYDPCIAAVTQNTTVINIINLTFIFILGVRILVTISETGCNLQFEFFSDLDQINSNFPISCMTL